MNKKFIMTFLLAAILAFSGCESGGDAESGTQSFLSGVTETTGIVSVLNGSDMFTARDMEIGYDVETSARIMLSANGVTASSDDVSISGDTVTITNEGIYVLSGETEDVMIVVSAGETDKIQLVLNSVNITNSDSAAVYIKQADKVFITTVSGTENVLANSGGYKEIDENNVDAVIFSKSDLTLNGAGTLTVTASEGHGIVSKDDLVLTSGTYYINASKQGISGKNSVRIANGTYIIETGKDGIHAENADDADSGFIYISGGIFEITADGDGVSAGASLQIDSGTFNVITGEGSASVEMSKDDPGSWWNGRNEAAEDSSPSTKGVKAGGTITIMGGSLVTDTADDSIHSGGNLLISDGDFVLKSGDDAIHSDQSVLIEDGTFIIAYCYEGIEGLSVTVDGGSFDIDSVDDGINAAGGADSSGFGGGRPGMGQFSSGSDSFITINGGRFVIVSGGDCIDSNGDLTINGGALDLVCNGNGDTALDCDGSYENNGGDVTTNDGSENNPGQMGGGMGGHGGGGMPGGGPMF